MEDINRETTPSGEDQNVPAEPAKGTKLLQKNNGVDASVRTIEISAIKSYSEAESKVAKTFWLVLFLFGLAVFIWQMYKTIMNYVDSPIVSTYTITTVPEMAFPVVYICPMSYIRNDFLKNTPKAEEYVFHLKKDMNQVWEYVEFLVHANLWEPRDNDNDTHSASLVPAPFMNMVVKKPDFVVKNTTHPPVDPEVFFKNASIPLDMHLLYCAFRHFVFEERPCSDFVKEMFDPEYGKCYLIDVGNRTQTVQNQALHIGFDVNNNAYPVNSSLTPLFNGIYLSVENALNVRPYGESVFLPPGSYNRIDLSAQKEQFITIDRPFVQKCVDDGTFEYQIFNIKQYTQQSCGYDCVARALKTQCNCIPPVDRTQFQESVLKETSTFCMGKHLKCIQNRVHMNETIRNQIVDCRGQCFIRCDNMRYNILSSSSTDLYPPGMADIPIPYDQLMHVLVGFSAMEYTQSTQDYSCSGDGFIAKVGGEINLWLGASLMTVVQIPVAVIAICGYWTMGKTKKVVRKRDTIVKSQVAT